ncbi:hypothetical protein [Rahnella sp. PCH160]|uniref:hypothetical protein n=1 Tax=Rahnella sp. PCH160 TaxID=3447928 RepID=UPI0039FC7B29
MSDLYDNTQLELEEIVDQCRALAYAIVTLDNAQAKDLLGFILCERLCKYPGKTNHSLLEIFRHTDYVP